MTAHKYKPGDLVRFTLRPTEGWRADHGGATLRGCLARVITEEDADELDWLIHILCPACQEDGKFHDVYGQSTDDQDPRFVWVYEDELEPMP